MTVLGHIQRGGAPSARDRETASRMGYTAVEAIAANSGKPLPLRNSSMDPGIVGQCLQDIIPLHIKLLGHGQGFFHAPSADGIVDTGNHGEKYYDTGGHYFV